jgi:hypothetical protein
MPPTEILPTDRQSKVLMALAAREKEKRQGPICGTLRSAATSVGPKSPADLATIA